MAGTRGSQGTKQVEGGTVDSFTNTVGRGAEVYGFRGTVWTRARIRQMIQDVFGVSYHVDHMSFLMQKIGWTQQQPRRRAAQQNQAAVETWEANWPDVEKKPRSKAKR